MFYPSPGTGEIHADPLFVGYDKNNFYLSESSPCRGAGEGSKDIGAKKYSVAVSPTSLGRVKALYN